MLTRQSYPLILSSYGAWEVSVKPAPLTRYKVLSVFSCVFSAFMRHVILLMPPISALTAEIGMADDHIGLALLAFHPKMA